MERLTLSIDGMSCGHCEAQVATALRALTGVTVERVTIGSATVSYDARAITPAEIAGAVGRAGYDARAA